MTIDSKLIERIEAGRSHRKLRFSLCEGRGWVTTDSEDTIRLLCDLWNNRDEIAAALRSRSSL